jgi:hypothetical protein
VTPSVGGREASGPLLAKTRAPTSPDLVPTLTSLSADDRSWREFAVEHATSPLQHPAWLDTLMGAYKLRAQISAILDSQGSILAGLPAIHSKLPFRDRWTSLPFTDTLEPIARDRESRDELLIAIAGDIHAEPLLIRTRAEVPGWFSRQVGTVQFVDLSEGLDGVLRRAHKKTRQNVRVAQRPENRLTARPIASRSEFLNEHLMLVARSRSRVGVPTQPRRYWSRVWDMHEREEALTIGVYVHGSLTATATFMLGRSHSVAKYSASDKATSKLRTNYLALITAIDELASRGIGSLDFGLTDLGNRSLRNFKVHWGGEERPAYFSATHAELLPDTVEPGRLLTRSVQSTPVFVGRAIGALAYPFVA